MPAHIVRNAQNWLWANGPNFVTKKPVVSKFAKINPMDYHVWGAMLEAYHKLKTKLKTSAEVNESLQVIWSNLSQGPTDKTVKDFLNQATEGLCWSLELAVDTYQNIHSDNVILASDHYLTVLFQRCY